MHTQVINYFSTFHHSLQHSISHGSENCQFQYISLHYFIKDVNESIAHAQVYKSTQPLVNGTDLYRCGVPYICSRFYQEHLKNYLQM